MVGTRADRHRHGDELGDLDTLRLRTHDADAAAVGSVTAEIQAASRQGNEPDLWQVVIAANVDLAGVIDAARAQSAGRFRCCRHRDAVPPEGTTVFEFTSAGRAYDADHRDRRCRSWLTSEEATLCAAIVDVTRVTPTTDIPNFAQAADGWRSVADQRRSTAHRVHASASGRRDRLHIPA